MISYRDEFAPAESTEAYTAPLPYPTGSGVNLTADGRNATRIQGLISGYS